MAAGLALCLTAVACSGGETEEDLGPELGPELEHDSGPETQVDATSTTSSLPTTMDDSIYHTDLVVDLGDVVVTFDRWFFALQDPDTVVTVTNADGTVLAQGTVAGPGAIMRETADNSFEFVDASGQVVATVTQEQLADATDAALAAARGD
jgi:hypothetical protein